MKIAITGRPGSGKTTLCRRLIEVLRTQIKIGGILTQEVRDERGERLGFEILDIATGRKGTLAHVDLKSGPRVSKYRVNLPDIEGLAVPAIERALLEAELVVIDEIAPMELKSTRFIEVVEQALESDKRLLITFQQRSEHRLVEQVRKICQVHEITLGSREELFKGLRGLFSGEQRPIL